MQTSLAANTPSRCAAPREVAEQAARTLRERRASLTALLEEITGRPARIEILSRGTRPLTAPEHYLLRAGATLDCAVRTGLLRAGGLVAAETTLVWLPGLLPPAVREALAEEDAPAGELLAPLGVIRADRSAAPRDGLLDATGEPVAVISSAVLKILKGNRRRVRVAIAGERISGDAARLIADHRV